MKLAGAALIFVATGAITSVFFLNFCATLFQCGCQSLWTLAAKSCNMHASHGRHCPFCSFGQTGYLLVYGGMLGAQAVASFLPLVWGWSWLARLATALTAFPATGLVLGVVLGFYTGYWN